MVTVHHGHTPEIVFTSDTTTEGIWAMEDELWWTNGDREEHLHGYGHYRERYRKVNDQWPISYRRMTPTTSGTPPRRGHRGRTLRAGVVRVVQAVSELGVGEAVLIPRALLREQECETEEHDQRTRLDVPRVPGSR
nr:hypothetical protein [Prescottella equi]